MKEKLEVPWFPNKGGSWTPYLIMTSIYLALHQVVSPFKSHLDLVSSVLGWSLGWFGWAYYVHRRDTKKGA